MKKAFIVLLVCFMTIGCEDNFSPEQDPGSPAASLGDGTAGTTRVEVILDLNFPKKGQRGRAKGPAPAVSPSDQQPASAQPDTEQGSETAVVAASESDADQSGEEDSTAVVETAVAAPSEESDALAESKQLDILVYLGHKQVGKCWKYFSHSIGKVGFLSPINKLADWQLSVSFSSDSKLYKFRRPGNYYLARKRNFFGGPPISVLKKKDIGGFYGYKNLNEADESLAETIDTEYYRRSYYDEVGGDHPPLGKPVFGKYPPEDPLSGLNSLLERNPKDFVREGATTFVLLFEYGKYRYTQQEWDNFSRQHEGIHFINLSSRIGAVSDHEGIDWIPCEADHKVAKHLVKYILGEIQDQ